MEAAFPIVPLDTTKGGRGRRVPEKATSSRLLCASLDTTTGRAGEADLTEQGTPHKTQHPPQTNTSSRPKGPCGPKWRDLHGASIPGRGPAGPWSGFSRRRRFRSVSTPLALRSTRPVAGGGACSEEEVTSLRNQRRLDQSPDCCRGGVERPPWRRRSRLRCGTFVEWFLAEAAFPIASGGFVGVSRLRWRFARHDHGAGGGDVSPRTSHPLTNQRRLAPTPPSPTLSPGRRQ
jgi:hypothetical protein